MHRVPVRALGGLLLSALAALAGPLPGPLPALAAPAQEGGSVDWVADDGECRCKAGNACWHYLRAPVEPPADACWCNFCVKVSRHDGTRAMPEGWNEICASNGKMDCFLKRHALSWDMVCSECPNSAKCCNTPNPGCCPRCGEVGPHPLEERQKEVLLRAKKERDLFASAEVVVVWTPHFYLVTDIPSLKIRTQGGSYRVVGTHELAHIYAERLEKAYRDFARNFGQDILFGKPAGVFLPKRESTAAKIQARYFRSPRTNVLYGGGNDGQVGDGFCFNGFCRSLQKTGGDDVDLHHAVRHMAAHLMISCWTKVDPNERSLPPWLFESVGHWLAKLHPLLADGVVWCSGEGNAISGSGKRWELEARKVAADGRTDPVESVLEKSTVELLTFEDHVRAWSWLDLSLAEDRESFVGLLRSLREQVPTRKAWLDATGSTPEDWDRRWKDRVLGRRTSMRAGPADGGDADGPGARERAAIRAEADNRILASRILSMGVCSDPRTGSVLVEQFGRRSDLVRESLSVLLSKTTDPAVLAAIRETASASSDPMVRAYAARVLGLAGDAEAGPFLRERLKDGEWLPRAEAALALMRIRDAGLVASVAPLLSDPSAKVRIAAMDALASAGSAAEKVLSRVTGNLDHPAWQVRSATADALGGIGSMGAVDALIARMTLEAGRVRKDCHAALVAITRDDLGLNPENWQKWWKRERERVGGGVPARPEAPAEPNPEDARYSFPERKYGMQVFSERIGYVLDMSTSMHHLFTPDPEATKRLRRKYSGASKFDISKEEILQSISELNPKAFFTVVAFADDPRVMSRSLIPAGSDGLGKAESFLRGCRMPPETVSRRNARVDTTQMTNFHGAMLEVLGIPGSGDPPPGFQETPDTMFFLTDGEPTTGEITEADTLLSWFDGLNRYARMRVHVIAYGDQLDLVFLSGLAGHNGGEFIQIREAKGESSDALPPTTPK